MASVFKRKGKGRWIIQYTDHASRRRERSSRTTDYSVALRVGAELEARAAERRMGVIDPRADAFAEQDRRPIGEHIADFESLLQARGRAASHVLETRRSIERVVKQIGARRMSDLSAFKVQTAVVALREEPILVRDARRRRSRAGDSSTSRELTERPMYRSARTCNKFLQAMTSFTRWLWRDGRMPSNPLLAVTRLNVDVDRRRRRRELTSDEIRQLLAAAEAGPAHQGLSGSDRAALYRLALGTGFRASELASLTASSFNLDGGQPTVTVSAGYSKRRREDIQPIRLDLAAFLRQWIANRFRKALVFATTRLPEKTAKMIAFDLGRAGIAERDANGHVADFHALRHTFISRVVRTGATVTEAQMLARHSSPVMTFGLYAHATAPELARVVARMPREQGMSNDSPKSRGDLG